LKKIDSQALGILNKSLGLTGSGSPLTELTDGVVDQSIDIAPIVRRSSTPAQTGGIFTGQFANIHPGGDTQVSLIFPYAAAVDLIFPPYLTPMPEQFDIWVLSAAMRGTGGSTLSAGLFVVTGGAQQGWGVNSLGALLTANANMCLAFWDAVRVVGTITIGIAGGAGRATERIGFRLPRSRLTQLQFRSTASAATTFTCDIVLGVFPVALGQDGLV